MPTKKRLDLTRGVNTVTMDTSNTFNNEGQLTNFTYPLNTDNYQHGFDSMGRLLSLTNVTTSTTLANGATYNAASQLTGLSYGPSLGWAETWTYNTLGQLTRLTVPSVMDMEYTFHATQNNGRITKQKDYISGEEVNYTYDSLNRLLTAATTSTAWGLSFGYDGFGNKLSQTVTKGSAPAMSVTVDAATNRLVGSTYDANGNLTVGSGMTLTYDISNRIATAAGPSAEWYGYAPGNKRVWKKRQTGGSTYEENVYFYAASGPRLGTYTLTDTSGTLALTVKSTNLYFGGKLIKEGTSWVAMDRLGSVRARHSGTLSTFDHFPYGEEKPSTTTQDRSKFATYFRDHTNLDYAENRYYTSGMGRFMTPDPYQPSGGVEKPESWNRYSYVENDPVNRNDPSGLEFCDASYGSCWAGMFFEMTGFMPHEEPYACMDRLVKAGVGAVSLATWDSTCSPHYSILMFAMQVQVAASQKAVQDAAYVDCLDRGNKRINNAEERQVGQAREDYDAALKRADKSFGIALVGVYLGGNAWALAAAWLTYQIAMIEESASLERKIRRIVQESIGAREELIKECKKEAYGSQSPN